VLDGIYKYANFGSVLSFNLSICVKFN
jgi:hypothetical protein